MNLTSSASDIGFSPLAETLGSAIERFTFPAYRGLLSKSHGDVIGVVAWRLSAPIGLALALRRNNDAELLSLFVQKENRNHGVGTRLLARLEDQLRKMGFASVRATYMTGKPGSAALERVLEKNGWQPPHVRMLVVKGALEKSWAAPWMRPRPLPIGTSIFPWSEVTPQEKEQILRSQRLERWIPDELVPTRKEKNYDQATSLALRERDKIVGWLITHRLDKETLRYTCNFVRKDLQRRGRLFALYAAAGPRMRSAGYKYWIGTVRLTEPAMANFARRWMKPYTVFFGETRGTSKLLR